MASVYFITVDSFERIHVDCANKNVPTGKVEGVILTGKWIEFSVCIKLQDPMKPQMFFAYLYVDLSMAFLR